MVFVHACYDTFDISPISLKYHVTCPWRWCITQYNIFIVIIFFVYNEIFKILYILGSTMSRGISLLFVVLIIGKIRTPDISVCGANLWKHTCMSTEKFVVPGMDRLCKIFARHIQTNCQRALYLRVIELLLHTDNNFYPPVCFKFRWTWWRHQMETFFRVSGHLCWEFNCDRWIPRTKASDAELRCFLWSAPE